MIRLGVIYELGKDFLRSKCKNTDIKPELKSLCLKTIMLFLKYWYILYNI
jgi:hypothetical protein